MTWSIRLSRIYCLCNHRLLKHKTLSGKKQQEESYLWDLKIMLHIKRSVFICSPFFHVFYQVNGNHFLAARSCGKNFSHKQQWIGYRTWELQKNCLNFMLRETYLLDFSRQEIQMLAIVLIYVPHFSNVKLANFIQLRMTSTKLNVWILINNYIKNIRISVVN